MLAQDDQLDLLAGIVRGENPDGLGAARRNAAAYGEDYISILQLKYPVRRRARHQDPVIGTEVAAELRRQRDELHRPNGTLQWLLHRPGNRRWQLCQLARGRNPLARGSNLRLRSRLLGGKLPFEPGLIRVELRLGSCLAGGELCLGLRLLNHELRLQPLLGGIREEGHG